MLIEGLMEHKACDIEYFCKKINQNDSKDGLVCINSGSDELKYRPLPNLNLEKGNSFESGNACWLISAIHLIASNPTLFKKIQSDKNLNGDSKNALIKLIGYVNKENNDLTLNNIIENMNTLGYKGKQDEATTAFNNIKQLKQLNYISLDILKMNGEISKIADDIVTEGQEKISKSKNNKYFIFYSVYGKLNNSGACYLADNVQINGTSYKANAVIMYNDSHYVCCRKIDENWYVFDDGREPRTVSKDAIFCKKSSGPQFSTVFKGNYYGMCIALYVNNKDKSNGADNSNKRNEKKHKKHKK